MKKIVTFLFLTGCFSGAVLAQPSLHSVVLIDKQDGASLNGRLQNQERILAELDTIGLYTGLALRRHVLADNEFTREGLEKLIAGLPLKPDDVLLFYFSGREHIARAAGGRSHQLKMGDGAVDLNQFYASLKGKARLALLLVDLCNGQAAYRDDYTWQPADRAKYEILFGQGRGSLLAVNHVPREQAGITVSENGSIFTQCLVQALHAAQPEKSWLATMSEMKALAIRRSGGRLNPQVTVEIVSSQNQSDFVADTKPTQQLGDPAPSRVVYKEVAKKGPQGEETAAPAEQPAAANQVVGNNANLTPMEAAKAESSRLVGQFQQQIQGLADPAADSKALIEEIMRLFVTEDRRLEISRLGGRQSRAGIRAYFSRITSQRKRYKISISFYQPTEITDLADQGNGVLHGHARIFQEFRKTNLAGKLIYGDRVIKLVELYARPLDEGQWKVGLGDITVEPGSTQPLPEGEEAGQESNN
jgi:Caspase domain